MLSRGGSYEEVTMDGDPERVLHDKRITEEALARVLAGKAASSETILNFTGGGV